MPIYQVKAIVTSAWCYEVTSKIQKDAAYNIISCFIALDIFRIISPFSVYLQIEKSVLFLLEQQGQLARNLSDLGEQHDALMQQTDAVTSHELLEAYRNVGQDLLRLLNFVELNAIGLRKILKKFDKRFGYKFTNYYVKTRANHPYSQLRQVFKHVVINVHKFYSSCLLLVKIWNS